MKCCECCGQLVGDCEHRADPEPTAKPERRASTDDRESKETKPLRRDWRGWWL